MSTLQTPRADYMSPKGPKTSGIRTIHRAVLKRRNAKSNF